MRLLITGIAIGLVLSSIGITGLYQRFEAEEQERQKLEDEQQAKALQEYRDWQYEMVMRIANGDAKPIQISHDNKTVGYSVYDEQNDRFCFFMDSQYFRESITCVRK